MTIKITGLNHSSAFKAENAAEHELSINKFIASMNKDTPIFLVAEPTNQYDRYAVAAIVNGKHVGYVARENTQAVYSNLNDEGTLCATFDRATGNGSFTVNLTGTTTDAKEMNIRTDLNKILKETERFGYLADVLLPLPKILTIQYQMLPIIFSDHSASTQTRLAMCREFVDCLVPDLSERCVSAVEKITEFLYQTLEITPIEDAEYDMVSKMLDDLRGVSKRLRNDFRSIHENVIAILRSSDEYTSMKPMLAKKLGTDITRVRADFVKSLLTKMGIYDLNKMDQLIAYNRLSAPDYFKLCYLSIYAEIEDETRECFEKVEIEEIVLRALNRMARERADMRLKYKYEASYIWLCLNERFKIKVPAHRLSALLNKTKLSDGTLLNENCYQANWRWEKDNILILDQYHDKAVAKKTSRCRHVWETFGNYLKFEMGSNGR